MPRTTLSRAWRAVLVPLLIAVLVPLVPSAAASAAGTQPWLHVAGNQLEDPTGHAVTLRGVSILPPQQNNLCPACHPKATDDVIDMTVSNGWNSKILRLPVTEADAIDPATDFATYIDPYVQHAVAKGLYVIVDLHFVSNYGDGSGAIPQSVVMNFWNYVAPRYAGNPNVLFEVFNEPIAPDDWATWKAYIQPVVDSIRSVAPDNVILMGSPSWSTRVNEAAADPITGGNIVYVYHLYPNQGATSAANLDARFGTAAASIPVFLSEFGWNPASDYSNSVTQGTTSCWGSPLRAYLDARPWISWTNWIFDDFYKPEIYDSDWNLLGGDYQGQFMKDWLADASAGVTAPPTGDPTGTIVDNGGTGYTDSGWATGSSTPGFYGTGYTNDGTAAASPGAWASFQPDLPTGTYDVYLRWPAASNRPAAAPVRVYSGDGSQVDTSKTVNEQVNGCSWQLVGSYAFTAGASDRVQILGDDAGYTVADAALFAPAGSLLSDGFQDGDTAGWQTSGGSWAVSGDRYRQTGASGEAIASAGSTSWTDYTYRADVQVDTPAGNAGLLFRYTDAANFYLLRLNAASQTVDLYEKVGGTLTQVASTGYAVTAGTAYQLAVTVAGNHVTGSVDGRTKIDWTNPSSQLTSGAVGLRSNTSAASYDNVTVTH